MIEGTQLQLVYTVRVSSISECHFLTTETIVNHPGDQFRAHPSCIYLYNSCKLYNLLVLILRNWIFCQSVLWWKGWMGKSLLCLLVLSVIFKTYLAIHEFFFSLFIYLTKYFWKLTCKNSHSDWKTTADLLLMLVHWFLFWTMMHFISFTWSDL